MAIRKLATVLICIFALNYSVQGASVLLSQGEENDQVQLREKRQAPQTTCAEVGQYCKYQQDCCSGLCLSFSYKCVTKPANSPFTPIITNPAGVTSTNSGSGTATNPNDVVNRFGEPGSTNTINGVASAASPPRTCAAVGAYCQYNTQCCSQRCLSFSYKCVPNPHEHANPGHFNQNNNIPQSTVFEVGQNIPGGVTTLEELANRFGDNNAPNNTIAPPPTAQSAPVQPVIPIAGSQVNRTNCLASGAQCEFSSQCCTDYCAAASLNTRVCEVRTQTAFPTAPQSSNVDPVNRCLVIGATCYTHAECCSERCHIYLHQCVT